MMETFKKIFNSENLERYGITMSGSMVLLNGEIAFNTEGYNLLYNLHRLTGLLKKAGYFE